MLSFGGGGGSGGSGSSGGGGALREPQVYVQASMLRASTTIFAIKPSPLLARHVKGDDSPRDRRRRRG